jgi:peroxiredoxin
MPALEELYRRFRAKGLIVLVMSDEEHAKVASFIGERKFTYPILLDPERNIHKRFHVQGIPVTLVYDRNGALVAQSADMRTMSQFLNMLQAAGLH